MVAVAASPRPGYVAVCCCVDLGFVRPILRLRLLVEYRCVTGCFMPARGFAAYSIVSQCFSYYHPISTMAQGLSSFPARQYGTADAAPHTFNACLHNPTTQLRRPASRYLRTSALSGAFPLSQCSTGQLDWSLICNTDLRQRLCAHSQPRRDRLHRRPLGLIVAGVRAHQSHRPRLSVRVVPARHRAILPSTEGADETRDGSPRPACSVEA